MGGFFFKKNLTPPGYLGSFSECTITLKERLSLAQHAVGPLDSSHQGESNYLFIDKFGAESIVLIKF